jgi:peptidoglycan-associated lipoprotein
MSKNISIIFVATVMAFAVGCTPKKKADDQTGMGAAGTGAETAQVSSEPMSFNAAGSDSGQIAGLRTLNFAYDSSSIDGTGREILAGNAKWMKDNAAVNIQIEGHCDSRGSVEYNIALGERRAKAVKNYLVGLGVDTKRLTVISYGKEKPLEVGDSEAIMAKNRRANFVPLK